MDDVCVRCGKNAGAFEKMNTEGLCEGCSVEIREGNYSKEWDDKRREQNARTNTETLTNANIKINLCKNCNKEISMNVEFCRYCGYKVEKIDLLDGRESIEQPFEQKSNGNSKNNNVVHLSKKSNKGLVIGIICIVLVVIIGIFVAITPSQNFQDTKAAVDDMAYYYSKMMEAAELNSDTFDGWVNLFDTSSDRFDFYYNQCSSSEQKKLIEYYSEQLTSKF